MRMARARTRRACWSPSVLGENESIFVQAFEENFHNVGLQEVKIGNDMRLRRRIYIDLTGVERELDSELNKHKGTHDDILKKVAATRNVYKKLSTLMKLDNVGYNLVVVVCKRGRHWSPAVAEMVNARIAKRMYPDDHEKVQCLHLQQWDSWMEIGTRKMCPVGCTHCNIFFEDGFPIPKVSPDTDRKYHAINFDRYNANFTNAHADAFHLFEKYMDELGFIPKALVKVKLETLPLHSSPNSKPSPTSSGPSSLLLFFLLFAK